VARWRCKDLRVAGGPPFLNAVILKVPPAVIYNGTCVESLLIIIILL
jgi:hypothetical protein